MIENIPKNIPEEIDDEHRTWEKQEEDLELEQKIHKASYDKCYEIAKRGTGKAERSLAFSEVKEDIKAR